MEGNGFLIRWSRVRVPTASLRNLLIFKGLRRFLNDGKEKPCRWRQVA